MKQVVFRRFFALWLAVVLLLSTSAIAEASDNGESVLVLGETEEAVELGEVDLLAVSLAEEGPTEQADNADAAVDAPVPKSGLWYPIDRYNFPDSAFRKYVKDSFDYDGDGSLSEEECQDVTEITVDGLGIKSLSGIEIFEDLETLYCEDNRIKTLDLSNNTSLASVYCHNNGMASLSLPQSDTLETLWCNDNKLTSLDLSSASNLSSLFVCYNNIEWLDLCECDVLIGLLDESMTVYQDEVYWGTADSNEYIYIDRDTYLWSSAADETLYKPLVVEIDAEHFPARDFRSYVLEHCDNNGDGWLDVEEINDTGDIILRTSEDVDNGTNKVNCPNLKGIEYFTNLYSLECVGCGLKTLDLSKNTELSSLWCDQNRLTKLDLRKLTKLGIVSCNNNKLTTLDLRKQTTLSILYCEYNRIKHLYLGKNKKLRDLATRGNKLNKIEIKDCTKLRRVLKNGEKNAYDDCNIITWNVKDKYLGSITLDKKTKLTASSKVLFSGK